jgi:hypothetical protein
VDEQIVVPFPETLDRAPEVTLCRSTLLLASIHALRHHGHYERYESLVAPEHLEIIRSTVAGVWLPVVVGIDHYRGCDGLGLEADQQVMIGSEVVHAIQRTYIGSLLRLASSGALLSPMVGVKTFATIFAHSFKGGGMQIVQTGPKHVRVEIVGQPLNAIPYFRMAFHGFIQAGCQFFAPRAFVDELPRSTSTTFACQVSWT